MPLSRELVRRAIEPVLSHFRVPGIVAAWAFRNEPAEFLAVGTDAAGYPLAPDSLFPVASITKLATALAVLRLVNDGSPALDDPLTRLLPDSAAAQSGVTLRMLLSHASGLAEDLAPGAAPYDHDLTWRGLAEACLRAPVEAPPFTRVHYSNIGYGLIAIIVERRTGQAFPRALQQLVLEPLGIEGYLGAEPSRPQIRLADVRSDHVNTPLEPYNSPFWRALGVPWGGLTTTAEGVLRLIRALAGGPSSFLSEELRLEAVSNQTDELPGGYGRWFTYAHCKWGLGPDIYDHKKPHWAPEEASAGTFGHAGASGAVTWCDPEAGVAWAVLGSRTMHNGWLLHGSPSIGRAILEGTR